MIIISSSLEFKDVHPFKGPFQQFLLPIFVVVLSQGPII